MGGGRGAGVDADRGVNDLTIIEDIARWSAGLSIEEIPPRVVEIARSQVLSVLGAIHAGAGCAGGQSVVKTVEGMGVTGPCGTYPGGKGSLLFPAILLSGMMFPVENMPLFLRIISGAIPARWYILAVRKIMIEGLGFPSIARELAILGGMTLLVLAAGLKNFKIRLE